jgi:hypothetical protein
MTPTCTPTVAAVQPLKTRLEDDAKAALIWARSLLADRLTTPNIIDEAIAGQPLSITLTFADSDDLFYFQNYVKQAKNRDGAVTGLTAGLMCAAVKRAKIQ